MGAHHGAGKGLSCAGHAPGCDRTGNGCGSRTSTAEPDSIRSLSPMCPAHAPPIRSCLASQAYPAIQAETTVSNADTTTDTVRWRRWPAMDLERCWLRTFAWHNQTPAAAWGHTPERSHGLNNATPIGSKSAVLRVTTVNPCTSAVAAISASRSGRGSGTCKPAHRRAIAMSIGKMRAASGVKISPSSHRRKMPACVASRRSISNVPLANSRTVTMESA